MERQGVRQAVAAMVVQMAGAERVVVLVVVMEAEEDAGKFKPL
jgi:hypothetical protein